MADQLTGHNRRNSRVSPFGLSLSITLSFTSHAEMQPGISSHNQSCNSFVHLTTGLGQTNSNIMMGHETSILPNVTLDFIPSLSKLGQEAWMQSEVLESIQEQAATSSDKLNSYWDFCISYISQHFLRGQEIRMVFVNWPQPKEIGFSLASTSSIRCSVVAFRSHLHVLSPEQARYTPRVCTGGEN